MLHGVGGGRGAWAGQLGTFAAAGYRAVAWDAPGYGDTPAIEPYDMAGLARALERLLDAIAAPSVVLLGHSMGGMLAQEAVIAFPRKIAGLVLSATSPAFGRPDGAWQQDFLRQRLGPLDAGQDDGRPRAGARRRARRPGRGSRRRPARDRGHVARARRHVPQGARTRSSASTGARRSARSRVPVLAIAGERDATAPPAVMEKMAQKIPGAEYALLRRLRPSREPRAPAGVRRRRARVARAAVSALKEEVPMYVPPPICGEGYPLSAEQRELLATASRLGREKFAPRAAQYDRDATFPFENYDDMRAAGLLRICVPKRYGGVGADFVTYSMVAAEIGRHCGATALTWNMHVCSTLWSGALADDLDMTPSRARGARAEPRASTSSGS